MTLYHATPKKNLDSIRENGLDPNRAKGKEALVWLHTRSRREWAILHTATKHKCEVSEVVIIEISVPRTQLRRRWRGLWSTALTLTEFGRIHNASEFTKSPVA